MVTTTLKRAGAATKSLLLAPHCHVFAKAVEFGVVGARGRQVAGLSKEAQQLGTLRKAAFGAIEARQELATWRGATRGSIDGEVMTMRRDSRTKHGFA